MAKVITLSQTFPSYHPKAGQRTYFVEQVLNALGIEWDEEGYLIGLYRLNKHNSKLSVDDIKKFFYSLGSLEEGETIDFNEKLHTIRAKTVKKSGEVVSRWKVGDKASLRVWSGKPYNSPQIIIAPDVELVQVWNLEVKNQNFLLSDRANGRIFSPYSQTLNKVASNDGLESQDFLDWFKYPKPFEGQILAWKEVDYV